MKIDTKCVQAGYEPQNGEPRVLPIVQSTTFVYDSAETMGKLFDLEADGCFYTRLANPTLNTVASKIAALEGGVGAMLTASGQAASLISITNIAKAGDHVIASAAIYGGTFNLFNKTLRDLGIAFDFVSPVITAEELDKAFQPNTKAVFIETVTNPSLDVVDIELFAKVAHAHHVPLIVDNTFATPINCRPFEWGADIVVHSTSKYMDGHAVALGGVVVDSGNFDWTSGDFPMLTTPDETYHGVVYTEQFGKAAYITKCCTHLMRDFGAQQSPQNAFLLNLGLDTLALRMARHCSNAQTAAEFVQNIFEQLSPYIDPDLSEHAGQRDTPFKCLLLALLADAGHDLLIHGFHQKRNTDEHRNVIFHEVFLEIFESVAKNSRHSARVHEKLSCCSECVVIRKKRNIHISVSYIFHLF